MPDKQEKIQDLKTLRKKGGNNASLFLLNKINDLIDRFSSLTDIVSSIKKKLVDVETLIETNPQSSAISDEAKIERIATKLAVKHAKIEKGEKGDVGESGEDADEDRIAQVVQSKIKVPKDGSDGKDADEKMIIERVEKKIPKIEEIEDDLPKLGKEIRNGLELLQGKERLDVSAIKGLTELLKKVEKRKTDTKTLGAQTGFNASALEMHIVDPYTPTGTINGSNKDFELKLSPSPTTSLEVYRGGALQILNSSGDTDEDYSLSGTTITFNIAPVSGEKLRVKHRI